MLGNYKKIAMIDNVNYKIENYTSSKMPEVTDKITISNLNLNFVPSFFIVGFKHQGVSNNLLPYSIDTRNDLAGINFVTGGGANFYKKYIKFNRENSSLTLFINTYKANMSDFSIIAIE